MSSLFLTHKHTQMEKTIHELPPLKRYSLMLQQDNQNQHHGDNPMASLLLPAKKRKQSCDSPPPLPPNTTTFCLPAKKRIWAFQPNLSPIKPTSQFDLNVEYNPSFDKNNGFQINQHEKKEVDQFEGKDGNTSNDYDHKNDDNDDDGIVCAICQSTDGDPSDPIVFCDGCDLMVHATCFGYPLIENIPEGDWFCTKCLASQSSKLGKIKPFSCCLCPVIGGAMKPTNDGNWAHLICALLVPEVFFEDSEGREGIDCSKVPQWRWKQRCYVCENEGGCVVDCSEPKCSLAFHVTCGLKEDLCIEYREGKNKGAIVAGFCKSHTDLWKKQQETGKFKIVAREEHKK